MTPEWAETLALQALAHIVSQPELCGRFLNLTGIDPSDLPARVSDGFFLGAVLDFLLGNEPNLLDFCSAAGIEPRQPALARHVLQGGDTPDWS